MKGLPGGRVGEGRTCSDLKVHGDGRSGPFLLIIGRQQLDLSADLRFLHPGHAFDPADDGEGGGLYILYILQRI